MVDRPPHRTNWRGRRIPSTSKPQVIENPGTIVSRKGVSSKLLEGLVLTLTGSWTAPQFSQGLQARPARPDALL